MFRKAELWEKALVILKSYKMHQVYKHQIHTIALLVDVKS